MICVHFCFVLVEIFLYNTFLTLLASEMVFIWLIYHGFMTLNKTIITAYIALMFLSPISGILFVLKIGDGIPVIIFLCQLAFYGYAGGYYTLYRFRALQA